MMYSEFVERVEKEYKEYGSCVPSYTDYTQDIEPIYMNEEFDVFDKDTFCKEWCNYQFGKTVSTDFFAKLCVYNTKLEYQAKINELNAKINELKQDVEFYANRYSKMSSKAKELENKLIRIWEIIK